MTGVRTLVSSVCIYSKSQCYRKSSHKSLAKATRINPHDLLALSVLNILLRVPNKFRIFLIEKCYTHDTPENFVRYSARKMI